MQTNEINEQNEAAEQPGTENTSDIKTESSEKTDENAAPSAEARLAELNDRYLRLYSEFDNYRRRTQKEKAEFLKTAAEEVFKSILPVIDDFERAIKANEQVNDATAIKEGVQLIYTKLKNNSQQKGLVAFDSIGQPFDADTMEAITHVPASDAAQKGTVIDEVEKGYKLGDKVIRFAKVVVAQ